MSLTTEDIRSHPTVLELTPQIIEHRSSRLRNITKNIECNLITGTKSEWEGKFQKFAQKNNRRQLKRPMFSPTEIEVIEEKPKLQGQAWIDGEMAPLKHKNSSK